MLQRGLRWGLQRSCGRRIKPSPLLGAQLSLQATQPHLALCLPPAQMCCDPRIIRAVKIKGAPTLFRNCNSGPQPSSTPPIVLFLFCFLAATQPLIIRWANPSVHIYICLCAKLACCSALLETVTSTTETMNYRRLKLLKTDSSCRCAC